jgi:transposase
VIIDRTRVCEVLVGLPDVVVLGVEDGPDGVLLVHVAHNDVRPLCPSCGTPARVKDRPQVTLVDLPVFDRRTRLVWHKHRWCCPNSQCRVGSWTHEDRRIASPRLSLTDRAGRWVTLQVGKNGRAVSDVASDLGCGWHVVNDAVIAYGRELVDDPGRIGAPSAVGLDETMFTHVGEYRSQCWSTQIVDVGVGVLLDVVEGRDSTEPCDWFTQRSPEWRAGVKWATLDLSASYRKVFTTMLPETPGGVEFFV